jgi:hypothetical protein
MEAVESLDAENEGMKLKHHHEKLTLWHRYQERVDCLPPLKCTCGRCHQEQPCGDQTAHLPFRRCFCSSRGVCDACLAFLLRAELSVNLSISCSSSALTSLKLCPADTSATLSSWCSAIISTGGPPRASQMTHGEPFELRST